MERTETRMALIRKGLAEYPIRPAGEVRGERAAVVQDEVLRYKADIAKFLGVTTDTLKQMRKEGLPIAILGGRWMSTKGAVLNWVRRKAEAEARMNR